MSGPEPIISLPTGGGALQGIGESFSSDLHTGTGNFVVPITLPAGRNGFQPRLSLGYSSGNGNGPFGLGWRLSVPGVSRKTSSGVPRYQDGDTFLLSGAEDLVPVAVVAQAAGVGARATSYRPRTEGLFARITHYEATAADYWEVRSRDGLISYYGTNPADAPVYPEPWPVSGPVSDASRVNPAGRSPVSSIAAVRPASAA